MAKAGDVVTLEFPGATGTKRRPAVVLSSDLYHIHRPDVIVGVLTTNLASATAPTDYVLQDWGSAGLRAPSAFRAYLAIVPSSAIHRIGRLSDQDWDAVRHRVRLASG